MRSHPRRTRAADDEVELNGQPDGFSTGVPSSSVVSGGDAGMSVSSDVSGMG